MVRRYDVGAIRVSDSPIGGVSESARLAEFVWEEFAAPRLALAFYT